MIAGHALGLKKREFTASDLVEACLSVIDDRDGHLRCFLEVDRTGALAQARESDRRRSKGQAIGRLDGIPVAVKGNLAVEGFAWSGGMATRASIRASEDAAAVATLRAKGAVIVGTTNLPEAAMGAVTANPWFGTCRSPRQPDRHAGGSSGGSGAAVAAGMAPLALGTDTMGSVRIPAAWCGVAGWTPSGGTIPTGGLIRLSSRLDRVGLLATGADDLWLAAQSAGFLDGSPPDVRPPRLLIPEDLVERTPADVRERFRERLSQLGWDLEKVRLGFDPARVRRAGLLAVEAESYLIHRQALRENPEGFSDQLRSMLEYADTAPAWKLARSHQILDRVRDRITGLTVSDHHLLALPTTPHPPLPVTEPEPDWLGDLTAFVNAAGACAVSIPVLSVVGGPVGLQLVGRPGADPSLLAAARDAERRLAASGQGPL